MKNIEIKADAVVLFNRWKDAVQNVAHLNNIIQNEDIIPFTDAQDFVSNLTKGINTLNDVGMEIVDYLKSNIIKDGKNT